MRYEGPLDETGGRSKQVAQGIDWAVDSGADVILLNFAGGGANKFVRAALARAYAAGVVLVAGVEDMLTPGVGEPGSRPEVITVSSTRVDDSFGFQPWGLWRSVVNCEM